MSVIAFRQSSYVTTHIFVLSHAMPLSHEGVAMDMSYSSHSAREKQMQANARSTSHRLRCSLDVKATLQPNMCILPILLHNWTKAIRMPIKTVRMVWKTVGPIRGTSAAMAYRYAARLKRRRMVMV
jgi:hypothetical protein